MQNVILQATLLTRFQRSRPPVMVSLTDLVNLDLIYTLAGCGIILTLLMAFVFLDIRLPQLMVNVLIFVTRIFMNSFLIYLSIGVVVQYIHVHLRSASIFERVSDETVRNVIRAVLGSVSILINMWRSLTDHRPSKFVAILTAGSEEIRKVVGETKQGQISYKSLDILTILTILCVVTNLALRILLFFRKKYHPLNKLPKQQQQQQQQQQQHAVPLLRYLFLTLFVTSVVFSATLSLRTHGRILSFRATLLLGLTAVCTVPLVLLILPDRGARRFAWRGLCSSLPFLFPSSTKGGNQVFPA